MQLYLEAFTSGPVATNSFLVWDDEKNAVLMDAPPGSFDEVRESVEREGLTLAALILTHTHWDHTADANRFREHFGDEFLIYVHPDDEYRLADPMKYLVWDIPLEMEPTKPDRYLHHGDVFELGGIRFDVLLAPGHTEGSICLYAPDHGFIVSGDVLFSGAIGRFDLPGGDLETLQKSIREVLMPLPDDTQVFPGHGPATTIGEERESNPYIDYVP